MRPDFYSMSGDWLDYIWIEIFLLDFIDFY